MIINFKSKHLIWIALLIFIIGLIIILKKKKTDNLPPAHIRDKVAFTEDAGYFLRTGKESRKNIESALARIDKKLGSFHNILDFGCGPGRTIRWLKEYSVNSKIYGTDVDAEAISWCQKNIDFANFSINKSLPPTEYEDEMFDFVYALSVFTHLSESEQFAWLKELKRIMKPEAILLISLHGADTQNKLPRKYKKILDEELFVHIKTERTGTFHSINYVYDNYSQYFKILDFIPASLQKSQDIYILKKV
ncbi:class I SAM-dependent methyltransferase [Thermoproteota archaeon]